MLKIGNYIFSLDLLEKKFICDLPACFGNCCRYGDSGAPLDKEEVEILDQIIDIVRPYLRHAGIKAIDEQGTSLKDFEGDMVTPLIRNDECAYTILDGNTFMCGIEKAWAEGKIRFRKPLSCNLFPVRMKKYADFTAVNIEEWSICLSARDRGEKESIYAFEFLKEPLIRAMGKEIYDQLCIAATELSTPRPPRGGEDPQTPQGGLTKEKKMHELEKPMYFKAKSGTVEAARILREKMTNAEKILWERLNKKQICNVRFRRQHPIDLFIADFYCHKAKLVIEVDGEVHEDRKEYDEGRTAELQKYDIMVLRFINKDIESDIEKVIKKITTILESRIKSPPWGI